MTQDAQLPQLETVLDPGAMLGVLSAECLSARFEALDCHVSHVRYKPGRNCLVNYELRLRENGDREIRQAFCGRAYSPGESESRWRKAMSQPLVDVATGSPLVHIERLGLVVWAFPNERKLRGMELLLDGDRLRDAVLPAALGVPRVLSAEPELVRYVPEHACTVRVRVQLPGREAFVLYGKLHAGGEGAQICERMRGLGRSAWHQPELRILWQEEVPGEPAPLESPMEPCARALAALHVQGWLHGDLHLKNFLIHGGEAALIDLDTLRPLGDPLEDIGSFAASLYHRAALGQCDERAVDEKVRAFTDEYARHVPWPATRRDIAKHTARAIVSERVRRSVSRRKGDVVSALERTASRLLAETATARDIMRRHAEWVASRPGEILDVHYKTYRKEKSWHKSFTTVAWRDGEGTIRVERNGAEPHAWTFREDPALPRLDAPCEVLTYRPGSRFTARYAGGAIYGKTYCDDRGERVNERLRQLAALGFLMPKPLGYSAASKTVWQAAFAGRPLRDVLDTPRAESLLAGAAARLRFLHESGIACPPRFTVAEQHADLAKKMAKLAAVVPEAADRLAALVEHLRSAVPQLAPVADCVVHGDFHVRQLVVGDDGEVALFDFDEIGVGDPVEDYGHFIADLHGDSAFRRTDVDRIAAALVRAAGWPVPADRLRWHTAVQLLTRAYRALLQLKPGFDERVERHIRLAEEQSS